MSVPRMQGSIDISQFARSQIALLQDELEAEKTLTTDLLSSTSPTTMARAGLAIINVSLASQRTGQGGRTILELENDRALNAEEELSEHSIRVGDVVRVAEQPTGKERKTAKGAAEEKAVDGVVVRSGRKNIQVALNEGHETGVDLNSRLWVTKLANEVTYKRMIKTMDALEKAKDEDHSTLTRILFGLETPTILTDKSSDWPKDIAFFDPTLNPSQQDAVRFAVGARELALIHGPPGTGKTYTLIEIIRQFLHRNFRVLVCGPSNVSVDNIVERLSHHKLPIIRMGHPARLLPSVLHHSLDALVSLSDESAIVHDVRKEMDQKQGKIKKTRNGKERTMIYREIHELRKEYRQREGQCVSSLLKSSKVVHCTLHGAGDFQLKNEKFDVVIIDEASQALEAACWIPLLNAKKVILAGDHLQLPPTIKSRDAKPKGGVAEKMKKMSLSEHKEVSKDGKQESKPQVTGDLETTMFDRLLSLHGAAIKRMLTVQYRMNTKIMRFPSDELYDGRLTAAPSVADRLLTTLPYPVKQTDDTNEALVFYDTQGGDFPENSAADSSMESSGKKSLSLKDSHSNEMEAQLAARHVTDLIEAGVKETDIAIITPYNGQLSILSKLLASKYPGLELGTVDGFQGREKEAVILSLVRSNGEDPGSQSNKSAGKDVKSSGVGFLGEKRRLNVGMTRPKRHLCVIGDSDTIGKGSPFLHRWVKYLEDQADVRYPDVSELQGLD